MLHKKVMFHVVQRSLSIDTYKIGSNSHMQLYHIYNSFYLLKDQCHFDMEETFDNIRQDISNENPGLPFLILNKNPIIIIFTTIKTTM
jgi:hypothetical protein